MRNYNCYESESEHFKHKYDSLPQKRCSHSNNDDHVTWGEPVCRQMKTRILELVSPRGKSVVGISDPSFLWTV